jgi:hypothetical protein
MFLPHQRAAASLPTGAQTRTTGLKESIMLKHIALGAVVVGAAAAFAAADSRDYEVRYIPGPRGLHPVVRHIDRSDADRANYALTGQTEREQVETPRALRIAGPRANQSFFQIDH